RLAVLEAPIDAMSLAGIERLRADTLYAATGGGMGPSTIAALEALLLRFALHPEAVLVVATDADEAGDRYAGKLMALAAAAKVRSGRILPFHGHKDWNEVAIARRTTMLATQAEKLRVRPAPEPGCRP
ncbi:MAG: toprim domain-containing protein, partial [Janthinobacterium lividum]